MNPQFKLHRTSSLRGVCKGPDTPSLSGPTLVSLLSHGALYAL
jgi:hypothetical protein